MVAIPRTRARTRASRLPVDRAAGRAADRVVDPAGTGASTREGGTSTARPLPYAEAAALVVPHEVLVPAASGWESAWLLACGPRTGERRYLVQREAAGSSEPEWLAEGPLALPAPRRS
jgi:hypothetical protein